MSSKGNLKLGSSITLAQTIFLKCHDLSKFTTLSERYQTEKPITLYLHLDYCGQKTSISNSTIISANKELNWANLVRKITEILTQK